MWLIDYVHGHLIHDRRTAVLSRWLAKLAPNGSRILDVGCGDGLVARRLMDARPDLDISGIDVLARSDAHIPVKSFNGSVMPFPDKSFDTVMFIDVLHHTDDANVLLREARRVAKSCILIKDHRLNGIIAGPTLRFMDHVGNARHGVRLPYNYWSEKQWRDAFSNLNLKVEEWHTAIGLYGFPLSWIFGRSLHFFARLSMKS